MREQSILLYLADAEEVTLGEEGAGEITLKTAIPPPGESGSRTPGPRWCRIETRARSGAQELNHRRPPRAAWQEHIGGGQCLFRVPYLLDYEGRDST